MLTTFKYPAAEWDNCVLAYAHGPGFYPDVYPYPTKPAPPGDARAAGDDGPQLDAVGATGVLSTSAAAAPSPPLAGVVGSVLPLGIGTLQARAQGYRIGQGIGEGFRGGNHGCPKARRASSVETVVRASSRAGAGHRLERRLRDARDRVSGPPCSYSPLPIQVPMRKCSAARVVAWSWP